MQFDARQLPCIMPNTPCFVPSIAAIKWAGTTVSTLTKFNGGKYLVSGFKHKYLVEFLKRLCLPFL